MKCFIYSVIMMSLLCVFCQRGQAQESQDILAVNAEYNQRLRPILMFDAKSSLSSFLEQSLILNRMYGLSLDNEAVALRVKMLKRVGFNLWKEASFEAQKQKKSTITPDVLQKVIDSKFVYNMTSDDELYIRLGDKDILLQTQDFLKYSKVSDVLKSLTALQQQEILSGKRIFLSLERKAIMLMKECLDTLSLAVLKQSSEEAQSNNENLISEDIYKRVWNMIISDDIFSKNIFDFQSMEVSKIPVSQSVFMKYLVKYKITLYRKHSFQNIGQTFEDMIQDRFSKMPFEEREGAAQEIIRMVNKVMFVFAMNLYHQAQTYAIEQGHDVIQLEDMLSTLDFMLPLKAQQQNVVFFPLLYEKNSLDISMNHLRDFSDFGFHWWTLLQLVSDENSSLRLELDPYAAEMMAEAISQYGFLMLRMSQKVTTDDNTETPVLTVGHMEVSEAMFEVLMEQHYNEKFGDGKATQPLASPVIDLNCEN